MYTNYRLNRDRSLLVSAFNDCARASRPEIPQLTARRVTIKPETDTSALVEITLPLAKKVKQSFQGQFDITANYAEAVRKLANELRQLAEETFARSEAILALHADVRRAVFSTRDAVAREWHGFSVPIVAIEPSPIQVGQPPKKPMQVILRDWDDFLAPERCSLPVQDAEEAIQAYIEHVTVERLFAGMRAGSVRSAGATGLIAESVQILIQQHGLDPEDVYDRLLGCGEEGIAFKTAGGDLRLYYRNGLVTCDTQIAEGVRFEAGDLHFARYPEQLENAAEEDRIGDHLELSGINPDALIISVIKSDGDTIVRLDDEEMYFWSRGAASRARRFGALGRIAA